VRRFPALGLALVAATLAAGAPAAARPAIPLADVRGSIRELIRLAKANAFVNRWIAEARATWAEKTVYAPGFAPGG
jgi:hypothetical protein